MGNRAKIQGKTLVSLGKDENLVSKPDIGKVGLIYFREDLSRNRVIASEEVVENTTGFVAKSRMFAALPMLTLGKQRP